jgi:uncharacterized repeat protein (TIGR03806 family)
VPRTVTRGLGVAAAALVGCSSSSPAIGLDDRPVNATCVAPARPPTSAPIAFQRVYQNITLNQPLVLAQIPGDRSRWFVAQRDGTIVSFPTDGSAPPTLIANVPALAGLTMQTEGEGGLLGLAFHPQFATNGKAYVSWTPTDGANMYNMRSLVGTLHSPDNGASFTSHRTLLGPFDQPANNHNGGTVLFGPDGLLYLSFGDGGFPTPAQDPYQFFAKILRIDVDNVPAGATYGIPADNPFAAGGGEPATFARGLRNPFRFSIDRATGEVWVGEVGQNMYEEIDRVELGGNYGWPCREGAHDFILDPTYCPSTQDLIDPIVEHEHTPHRSITGGVVYRGSAIPAFVGNYVYGDFVTQELFAMTFDPTTGAAVSTLIEGAPAAPWVQFAEDNDGEVYALAIDGSIYKMVAAAPPSANTFPARLSETGCVDPAAPGEPASGLVPYDVIAQLWSDGAAKQRYVAIPDGTTIAIANDEDLELPIGSVVMKTFALADRNVETRLLVRHDDGEWAGYSYEWLDDQSDALLLPASKTTAVDGQSWRFPSRSECMRCHTSAAGRTLGLELQQLDRDFAYPTGRSANQIRTLAHIGLLDDAALGIADPMQRDARAYLHANCSHCHRPEGGAGRSDMDLRYTTPLAYTNICDVAPKTGELGITDGKLLAPGAPERSLISARMHALGAYRMPPLATSVVDEQGTALVDVWIRSLRACP